jgi:hypothetical protein
LRRGEWGAVAAHLTLAAVAKEVHGTPFLLDRFLPININLGSTSDGVLAFIDAVGNLVNTEVSFKLTT